MNNSKTPCIYKITNVINDKIYVGSCVCLAQRKGTHLKTARNGTHCNKHFQRAWNKYGESSFKFDVIEYVYDKNTLICREQYYLDTLKPEYNQRTIADSNIGIKRTEEHKDKMKEGVKKLRKLTEEQVREVQNLRESGYTISYISNICRLEESAISRLLSGKSYKEFYKQIKLPNKNNRGRKLSNDMLQKIKYLLSTNMLQSEIAKIVGIDQGSISRFKNNKLRIISA